MAAFVDARMAVYKQKEEA
jgi:hypothetical protein